MENNSHPQNGAQAHPEGEDKAGNERRGSGRLRTVCRIARVRREQDIGLWRVHNISNEGLMLGADVVIAVGEKLEIALSETTILHGTVVWAAHGRCGVSFAAPVDAAAVLRGLADEQRAEGYRALRLPVQLEAIAMYRDDSLPIDLVDISQHGAGFRYDRAIEPGTELALLLPLGELRRRAIVRWSRGSRGGLWFTQPLDRADLESIAHECHGRTDPGPRTI